MLPDLLLLLSVLPSALLAGAASWARRCQSMPFAWGPFRLVLFLTLVVVIVQALGYGGFALSGQSSLFAINHESALTNWLQVSTMGLWMALLVQILGLVIGVFSSRYLQGEADQYRYASLYLTVLALVHLLLIANHWLVFIAAWAAVGMVLKRLLCFYRNRPFALLAAHKKTIADRFADVLLIIAATLVSLEVESGSFSTTFEFIALHGATPLIEAGAVLLALAVIVRTALFPVHGWMTQVMEAPTPVSALLHAGVINLGGFVLIQFAPLLEHASAARWVLVVSGLVTAVLAGFVMLTRVSIKVKLAWSTVAQMGFMILECGLGLYTLAALHLVGHSLYKAHTFLAASSVVQSTKTLAMRGSVSIHVMSLFIAPVLALGLVFAVLALTPGTPWPSWWSVVLGLAWAPLLWLPVRQGLPAAVLATRCFVGMVSIVGLTSLALLAHLLPFGVSDSPLNAASVLVVFGMGLLYAGLALIQIAPHWLSGWRRWAYAGFYVDEFYTRLALALWPKVWNVRHNHSQLPAEVYDPAQSSTFQSRGAK